MSRKQRALSLAFQFLVVVIFGMVSDTEEHKVSNGNWTDFTIAVAKYVFCFLLIRGAKGAFDFVYSGVSSDILAAFEGNVKNAIIFSIASTILTHTDNLFVGQQLTVVFVVHLLIDNPGNMEGNSEKFSNKTFKAAEKKQDLEPKPPSINYGTGMACSYFEGYLIQVLPNDGGAFHGIENKIKAAEASMGVRFPVRKLFIIITKSMYCPPELTEFNREDETLPFLEKCRPLEDVVRNVAGVIDRTYRNSVYQVRRGRGRCPVHVVAECASPLNTLHKVLKNRILYQTLSDIDVDAVVKEFCGTLQDIISRSEECRNKCELVYIDDTNPNENLAQILLDRIEEIAPNFERIIS